jgi:hypothetical protein
MSSERARVQEARHCAAVDEVEARSVPPLLFGGSLVEVVGYYV